MGRLLIMRPIPIVLGLVYVIWITVSAASMVGQMPEVPKEPYTWELPFKVFVVLVTPLLVGFLGGIIFVKPRYTHQVTMYLGMESDKDD